MLEHNKRLPLEQKIKKQRRLTYDILDGMVDWVRVMNEDREIIYINQSMKKALGDNLLGTKCYKIFDRDSKCVRCIGETTINTGESVEKEVNIKGRVFSITSSPVTDISGYIYAVVEVFRDVTRERRLERNILNQNEKMSRDIDFAKKIQSSILPEKGIHGPLKLDYLYKPSEILSGDMFDIQKIDADHIGVYISDVVGHGVSASIMTMFIRQTMESIMKDTYSPSDVISSLHRSFLDLGLDDENYFTIFYATFNTKDGTMKYSNGGHNSLPCIVSKDEEDKKGAKFLEAVGFPITYLFESVDYEEHEVKLNDADEVLFFTDGILECKDINDELFGEARLISAIENSKEDTIKDIEKAIDEFKGSYLDIDDDITILKIELEK